MLGQREPPHSRATMIMGLYGGMALLAVLISAGRGDPDIYRLDEARPTWWLALSLLLGFVLAVAVVVVSRVAVARTVWAQTMHRDFRAMLGDVPAREIFLLAVASAIGEELLFRGALGPWLGLVPQAVLFAALHVGPRRRHLVWTGWALGMGLAFGAMSEAVGDLGGAILAHFVINFANLHFIVRVALPAPAVQRSA